MAANTESEETVIDLLVNQHKQIQALFAEIQTSSGEQKTERFHDLVRLLAIHESAEEQVVHPAARRSIPDGEPVVDERLEEEKQAKQALAELYELGAEHPDFDVRLRSFAELILRHANAEEAQEFEQLRASVSESELIRMASAVRTAESLAPTRPHPSAGESPAANLLTGPPLAIFDRVRDALRPRHHG